MNLHILPSARQDIIDACQFYERQAVGVGLYFLDSIESDIEALREHAGIHVVPVGNYHRKVASRFPFAIYYRLEGDAVLVYAVLDWRRDPDAAAKKLG